MVERIVDVNDILIDDDVFHLDFEVERVFEARRKKWVEYLNVIFTWDTETTSFIHNGEKLGYCYVWCCKIGNIIVTGRYLEEFAYFLNQLSNAYDLSVGRRIIIWVHNLGFDFQFLRKYISIESVFAMDTYKPIKALTKNGFEFRDTYILTNSKLSSVAKSLNTATSLSKLVGDLDYELLRHSETVITKTEWEYIYNDVRIVWELIKERMKEENGLMTQIPLTSTGYVRRHVKNLCLPKGDSKETKKKRGAYRRLMNALTLDSDEYLMLKECFQGGFTHANCNKVAMMSTFEHVGSFDITSSYPTVCCARMFPMTKGMEIDCSTLTEDKFEYYLKYYCCCINATFYDVEPKIEYENIISKSKCLYINDYQLNNGRVMRAKELMTTFTETDFKCYKRFYKWSGLCVNKMIVYGKGFLPEPIITAILDLYEKKTTLKNVEDKKKEYNDSKALLNAIYGMTVTDIVRDTLLYDGSWCYDRADVSGCIDAYNKSMNRFLFYPWGVWVTSYARERLFEMIEACGGDYIYSDTDSVKILNPENHVDFIDFKNEEIINDISFVLKHYNIDEKRACPKTIKGVEKPLGVWDFEGVYNRFKTLGAKRYFVEKENGEYEITIAGVNKKNGVEYLIEQSEKSKEDIFDLFDFDLIFDDEHTGKKTHLYIDDKIEGYMRDYNGVISHFDSKSSVYLGKTSYNMSISHDYHVLLTTLLETKDLSTFMKKVGL